MRLTRYLLRYRGLTSPTFKYRQVTKIRSEPKRFRPTWKPRFWGRKWWIKNLYHPAGKPDGTPNKKHTFISITTADKQHGWIQGWTLREPITTIAIMGSSNLHKFDFRVPLAGSPPAPNRWWIARSLTNQMSVWSPRSSSYRGLFLTPVKMSSKPCWPVARTTTLELNWP